MPNHISANFAPFEERMRREGLPDITIENFRYYYDVLSSGGVGRIAESEIAPVESVPDINDLATYVEGGRAAIGRAVVLKLNGGLGTSMGLDKAKSLLVARNQLTFLDIIVRQTIGFGREFGRAIPLVLMNSFNTDEDTREVLARYPELRGPLPLTLMQHKIPKILQETLEPASWPEDPQLEWCPPGHGEVYIALAISGLLDSLLEHGYEYLFMSNVDNLGATIDLGILGYLADKQIPFLMEVTGRTEADKKGGHIARQKDGQLILREIAQCPEADLPAFQDVRRHKYFNTNNIWVNLARLKEIMVENDNVFKLPMIRNGKTVDPKDPASPAVFQLETAMGAAIAVFPGAQVLRVNRDRFMPVKTCDDLLRLRSDLYTLDESCRIRATTAGEPPVVELDPRYYRSIDDFEQRFPAGAPSLRECCRLSVKGNVLFGRGVVCRGGVQIVNRLDAQRRLPDGSILQDIDLDLSARVAA
ncbi:MAG: UTP--glucose-1-phosphate uridylyltransferase [Kouleothrix sp.]|nr:UTP--glucose-1-phosphate uridylyltransferase [Kouleothrix sp.]